jgi:hypothetical protein
MSLVQLLLLLLPCASWAASNEPPINLTQIDAQHYSTEHCLFIGLTPICASIVRTDRRLNRVPFEGHTTINSHFHQSFEGA